MDRKMDSFAYKQMARHGWTEGKGLGKNEIGASEAIKVGKKKGTGGLGHDLGAEFTNQWWDLAFNKAAAKVKVETTDEGVKVQTKDELTLQEKEKLKKKVLYGRFVKGTTLEDGKEHHEDEANTVPNQDGVIPSIAVLTDDQLLEACGGRTAHKAARHGFKLNGKLERIERHEQNHSTVSESKRKKEDLLKESTENNIAFSECLIVEEATVIEEPAVAMKTSKKKNRQDRKVKHSNGEAESDSERSVTKERDFEKEIKKTKRKKQKKERPCAQGTPRS